MNNDLKLKIDAHIIRQLGAELITSPVIAITELIKNSHDADAKWCKLEIETGYKEEIEVDPHLYPNDETLIIRGKKTYKEFRGRISILDDGCGMERESISKSWLTVSYSEKRQKKQQGEKTKLLDRNFTGDKGLGRLGSMQVASICRISSSSASSSKAIKVTINWDQLIEGVTIDQIKVDEESIEKFNPKMKGTTIDLIGLADLNFWSHDLTTFKYDVTTHISPFGFFSKRNDPFKLYIKINGIEEDTEGLTRNLLDLNSGLYEFKFNGEKLEISGCSTLLSFESQNTRANFPTYVLSDGGDGLFGHLQNNKELGAFQIGKAQDDKYFIRWTKTIDYDELFTAEKLKNTLLENPGSFDSTIYEFIYHSSIIGAGPDDLGFSKSKGLIQGYLSGIKVYRDGFKIGSGREDWFKLANEQTSGKGSYSLRPGNVAGYIDIQGDKNSKLVDTSNREGFVSNAAYRAFFEICMRAITEINYFRNYSRRAVVAFIHESKNLDNEKPKNYPPHQALDDLKALSDKAVKIHAGIKSQKLETDRKFQLNLTSLSEKIRKSEGLFTDQSQLQFLEELRRQLNELQDLYNSLEPKISEGARELASSSVMVSSINEQIKSYEEQIERFYSYVSIGLSAQLLAHDVNSQISHIAVSNHTVKGRLKALQIKDIEITKSALAIDGHVQALSKAISLLHPLMQVQRENKHTFFIDEGIESYVGYRSEHLATNNITFKIQKTEAKKISFNNGKFYQILDNVVRNSEYWLNSFGIHHSEIDKQIHIEVDGYKVTIWDTGKGVRPGMENAIFDMFITDKQDGQGLGLFIVKTLLHERKCSVYLLDDENMYGRKYKFRIDFSGAAL